MAMEPAQQDVTKPLRGLTSLARLSIMLFCCVLLAATAILASEQPPAEPTQYQAARRIAHLANQEIHESSGCAASLRSPEVFWTHNDSGSRPRLYAFARSGNHLATVDVIGAGAVDWEDMCSFRMDGRPHLLIGDTGDNQTMRRESQLYLIEEPHLQESEQQLLRSIPFRYEDGARNCEALAVDAAERLVLLITKQWLPPSGVYALELPEQPGEELPVARRIATVQLPLVTAMDISPDGRRAIVMTYGHAYQVVRRDGEDWASAFSRPATLVELPFRKFGEAICYGADGKTLYLTSETLPTPLWEVLPR